MAEKIRLINAFATGEFEGPEFARRWLVARRAWLGQEGLLDAVFSRALREVFALVEDYPIDPALREPGDVTDEDLRKGVQAVAYWLACLDDSADSAS
ncbi:colicin immunity domain-containing protein [Amycolatopsis sacchari]|uniref:colicin immunity domain-containing protein n=1 Tax=Amycolatopsis sacchari TaxID=115433 RepID=UPI003D713496